MAIKKYIMSWCCTGQAAYDKKKYLWTRSGPTKLTIHYLATTVDPINQTIDSIVASPDFFHKLAKARVCELSTGVKH